MLGVITAQSNELFADRATTIGFALATFGVLDNTLHLLTGRERAVGVATLTSMDQGLNAALDAQAAALLWTLGGLPTLTVVVVVQTKTPLDHLMFVSLRVVTVDAQIKVLARTKSKYCYLYHKVLYTLSKNGNKTRVCTVLTK